MVIPIQLIPRDTVVSVGTSVVELAPEVGTHVREILTITNTSPGGQIITIAFGKNAQAGVGIVLYPAGSWSESIDSAYVPSQQRVTAIANAAGGTVAVHERVGGVQ
jgi:hypothetical protein